MGNSNGLFTEDDGLVFGLYNPLIRVAHGLGYGFMKIFKFILFALVLVGSAAGVFYFLWQEMGREGTTGLEQWIGRQVTVVLESYITPELGFTALDYQAPYTVVLDGPDLRGADLSILSADRLILTLSEIPRVGQPIKIKEVRFIAPQLQLVRQPDGGLVGWSGFVRPEVLRDPESVPKDRRLSDVLVMEHFHIDDGKLIYKRDRSDAGMVFQGITVSLHTPPVPDKPGWYTLTGALNRDELCQIDVNSRINLDTAVLVFDQVKINAYLNESNYQIFPPQIQTFVMNYQVEGQLLANVQGELDLQAPESAKFSSELSLTQGKVTLGAALVPIDKIQCAVRVGDQKLLVRTKSDVLDGKTQLSGLLDMAADWRLQVNWDIANVDIQRAYAALGDKPSRYAGVLRSQGQFTARCTEFPESITGRGTVDIDNGKLGFLPLLRKLSGLLSIPGLTDLVIHDDKASVKFEFRPDHLLLTDAHILSVLIAVRGGGKIYYDTRLDLTVNAGPMKKLHSVLGPLGKLLGQITDRFLPYHVSGKLGEPEITPQPLGIRLK